MSRVYFFAVWFDQGRGISLENHLQFTGYYETWYVYWKKKDLKLRNVDEKLISEKK